MSTQQIIEEIRETLKEIYLGDFKNIESLRLIAKRQLERITDYELSRHN